MKEFITKHKVLFIVLAVLLVVGLFLRSAVQSWQEQKRLEEEERARLLAELEEAKSGKDNETSDSLLMKMQPNLIKSYGELPDGFVWQANGKLLSLGDKEMSSEDVVYAYFRGLSSLDMGTVERYSRESKVVNSYSGYFNDKDKNTDYTDQFVRNIYRECLLSIQIEKVETTSVFAENKKVFSMKAKILDLTDKKFWQKDKEEIFENLYLYESAESDSTKSDMYLYDYILSYYKSGNAELRDITFDITVQRYPDLDSGWLVSVDTDVDDACKYKDGKLVISYIRDLYRNEGRQKILDRKKAEREAQNNSSDAYVDEGGNSGEEMESEAVE